MTIFPPILADVITADMGFLPGLSLFGPAFGLPLSLLAALLERPFYTRAGISRWTIWYSLQANFVSLLVGYLLMPIALVALYGAGPLWLPVSVFVSIVVERQYFKWCARSSGFDGGWRRVSWANVFSSLALIGVLILSTPFQTPEIQRALRPDQAMLTYIGIGISLITFAVAFVVPVICRRREKRRTAEQPAAATGAPIPSPTPE